MRYTDEDSSFRSAKRISFHVPHCSQMAVHFHNTYGQGLANILVSVHFVERGAVGPLILLSVIHVGLVDPCTSLHFAFFCLDSATSAKMTFISYEK